MMLIFTLLDNDSQEIKYACSCESFAQGAGIDNSKLTVQDWKKFCTTIKGKKINFVIQEATNE